MVITEPEFETCLGFGRLGRWVHRATGFGIRQQNTSLRLRHFDVYCVRNLQADPWNSKVCVDGKLITGQNPQSSEACAAAVIAALK